MSERVFELLLSASVTAGTAAAAVALAGLFIKRVLKAPKRWAYMLWAVVFFRCLCPVSVESGLSLFNLLKPAAYEEETAAPAGADAEMNISASYKADEVPSEILFAPGGGEVPQKEEDRPADVYTVLLIIWACGAAAIAVYGAVSSVLLWERVKTAVKAEDGVFESDRILTAFTAGIFRPRIYLPCGLPENQRELIILHEKVHIRRRDCIFKPIAFAGLALHWFNPLIWGAFALMTRDMEMSCDETVLKFCGAERKTDYSEALLNVSVRRSGIAAQIGFGETGIKERVKNVLDYKKPRLAATVLAAAVMLTACAAAGTDAETEDVQTAADTAAAADTVNTADASYTAKTDTSEEKSSETSAGEDNPRTAADGGGNASEFGTNPDNEEYVPENAAADVPEKTAEERAPEEEKKVLYYELTEDGQIHPVEYEEERERLEEEYNRIKEEAEEVQQNVYYELTEDGKTIFVENEEKQAAGENERPKFTEDIKSSYPALKKPADSEISAVYGEKSSDGTEFHNGVDFKTEEGTEVCAAADGNVISASYKNNGYGICVIIDHGKGMMTLYAHLSEAKVSVGDEIKAGDTIGLSGSTGYAFGNHLHFEVRINGEYADPADFWE